MWSQRKPLVVAVAARRNSSAGQRFKRTGRQVPPCLEQLEDRLAPASATSFNLPAGPVSFNSATGLLAIVGPAHNDSVRISLSGNNLEVNLDGRLYSSNAASPGF